MILENNETKLNQILRVIVGLIFIVAGAGKLLLPLLIPIMKPGAPSFGDLLAQIGLPLPYLTSSIICALELVGGASLIAGRAILISCVILAGNMLGAMATVSIPGTFAQPIHLGEFDLGGEVWRLPLELTLFLMLVWLGSQRLIIQTKHKTP